MQHLFKQHYGFTLYLHIYCSSITYAAVLYLFTQQCYIYLSILYFYNIIIQHYYTYFIISHAVAMHMQQHYTNLYSSVTVAHFILYRNIYAAILVMPYIALRMQQ